MAYSDHVGVSSLSLSLSHTPSLIHLIPVSLYLPYVILLRYAAMPIVSYCYLIYSIGSSYAIIVAIIVAVRSSHATSPHDTLATYAPSL